ncbi:hypothetical protein DNTS_034117 [Danionella cerebrum]|uniref:MACPF domain-containing protein n=1 Tax=Danionella cerebrum TaxID=2873325 RepID=A0A553R6T3_9TELE|nr:hypothetical protein DNTS_034117 [Danionella translucida]TRY97876.1 hypothetical protein DNTS_034117 [Danionella translucida]
MRGTVLDNSFMGGDCKIERQKRNYYRIPANIETYNVKVEMLEDYNQQEVKAEKVNLAEKSNFFFNQASKASKQKDSEFYRIHQVVATSTFKVKPSDLYISDQFLKFLHSLPVEYNYALYRQIFQLFGTHYFSSGTLGGTYDLLFQYDREELKTFGLEEAQASYCINQDNTIYTFFYNRESSSKTCGSHSISTKYEGSIVKASEKCLTSVKGGKSEFTAALAWEKKSISSGSTTYLDWVNSTIENPTVINYQLLPLVNLVRGFSCAVTKRRHLHKALDQYMTEFDSCKCSPCPNNGRPALSGTECTCICQTGTYGENCEKRAPDYTSDAADGHWSCWSSWTECDATLKKHRTRTCNNPEPQRGGKDCPGSHKQEEDCTISIFKE